MASYQSRLIRARDNYALILVLCTEVIANPTKAGIDAVVDAATTTGIVRPKPTYSLDGESYDWTGYQQFIVSQLEALDKAIVRAGGPYEVNTRAAL